MIHNFDTYQNEAKPKPNKRAAKRALNQKFYFILLFRKKRERVVLNIGPLQFEQVYGQQVQNDINQLDGLHRVEGAQQMIDKISKLVEDAKKTLQQDQTGQAQYYDKHHHPVELAVNDKVLLATKTCNYWVYNNFGSALLDHQW